MSVPIAASPNRFGFGPQLSLSYDSGSGNDPFGLGWSFFIPSITRKTDKGLPQYFDAQDSDILSVSSERQQMRFTIKVILVCIRWFAAHPLSWRHLEEMMEECGVSVDHSTMRRLAIRFLSLLGNVFIKYKRLVGNTLGGIELMHMIRKGQMMVEGADKMSFAEQFYALTK